MSGRDEAGAADAGCEVGIEGPDSYGWLRLKAGVPLHNLPPSLQKAENGLLTRDADGRRRRIPFVDDRAALAHRAPLPQKLGQ